jgi:histidyl-tRNA synthetase
MNLSTQPYKGARDFYPEDKRIQKYMFDKLRLVVESFGYQEYDAPIIEPLDLYLSKSSDEIVAEQTYNFTDRGDRKVTLRPEMTPTISRMVAGRRQELAYPLRWYSIPDLWRYERPQAGRLRQHYQLNVDLFGIEGIEADHEIILVADSILQSFGAGRDTYTIRLNSRQLINEILSDFVQGADDQVLAVMRLIDHKSKVPHQEFLDILSELASPGKHHELVDVLSLESFDKLPDKYKQHPAVGKLARLKQLLAKNGINNVVDDLSLMRGFDYYTDIVFEVFDTHPDNNRSMFGGGRYDGLVGLFGVEPLPTVGFGMGDVTLQNFLKSHGLVPEVNSETDAVVILVGDVYEATQSVLAQLRLSGLKIAIDASERKLDTKIKHADKSGAQHVIFIGEKELAENQFKLRDLQKGQEELLSLDQISDKLKSVKPN